MKSERKNLFLIYGAYATFSKNNENFPKVKQILLNFLKKATTKIRDFYNNDPNFDRTTASIKKLFDS